MGRLQRSHSNAEKKGDVILTRATALGGTLRRHPPAIHPTSLPRDRKVETVELELQWMARTQSERGLVGTCPPFRKEREKGGATNFWGVREVCVSQLLTTRLPHPSRALGGRMGISKCW